jgi:7-cyano-7-deazaguanine synthase
MTTPAQPRAVVLLSGGMDSATAAAEARAQGFALYALSFDYGQRHRREVQAAQEVGAALGVVDHRIIAVDLRAIGGSALTSDIAVPHGRSLAEMGQDIPVTYVPGRNLIFLSLATAYAEILEANDLFIGVNQLDNSGYPDCRQEFLDSFVLTANLATKAGAQEGRRLQIHAPLIALTKGGIVRRGLELGVPFALTWSCYEGGDVACGTCDSCLLRLKGFAEAGVPDPIAYA